MEKQNHFTRSLLFSIVMCVLGGLLFGGLYYLGYFWPWLSVIEIVVAGAVYFKFINKPNIFHLFFCVIWCTMWAFVFNFLAVFICKILAFYFEYNMPIKQAYTTVMELWKNDATVKLYFRERLIQIGCLTLFGSLVGFIFTIATYITKKNANKKAQNNSSNKQGTFNANTAIVTSAGADFFETQQTSEYINVYNRVLKLCKDALVDFYENEDQDLLDRKIERIDERIISIQSPATKQLINTYANKELKKDLSKIDVKANELILKMV